MHNPTVKTVYPLDQTACRNIALCTVQRKEKAGTGRPHLLRKKCCAGKRLNQFLLF